MNGRKIKKTIGNKSSNNQIGLNASKLINNKYNLDIFNKIRSNYIQ